MHWWSPDRYEGDNLISQYVLSHPEDDVLTEQFLRLAADEANESDGRAAPSDQTLPQLGLSDSCLPQRRSASQ
jgi:hypothetical protein